MTVDARHSGLDVFAAKSGLISASQSQLQTWERDGLAYGLAGGEIVPACTTAQLNAAILRAKAAYDEGAGPEADPAFRRFLEGRCRVLGHPVPEWTRGDDSGHAAATAGKSLGALLAAAGIPSGSTVIRPDGTTVRLRVEPALRDRRYADGTTPAGRAFAEAQHLERKAAEATRRVEAEGFRQLAKQRYAEAGICR